MIISASMRTDIPAFYSRWFLNRIREGFVLVRSPYNPTLVSRYVLDPKVVDLISFCTKNPEPLLGHVSELASFRQYWFVTITPYGHAVEPAVPEKRQVIRSTHALARVVGKGRIAWRYDPVLITSRYTTSYHLKAFETMCSLLEGATEVVVVSFLDLYPKTLRNFPEARAVIQEEQEVLVRAMVPMARRHGMGLRLCYENQALGRFGADTQGCMTKSILDQAFGITLDPPKGVGVRAGCDCLLGGDIGAYSCCLHGCSYCYANENKRIAEERYRMHNPDSPLLIGGLQDGDRVHQVEQRSWIDGQMVLELAVDGRRSNQVHGC